MPLPIRLDIHKHMFTSNFDLRFCADERSRTFFFVVHPRNSRRFGYFRIPIRAIVTCSAIRPRAVPDPRVGAKHLRHPDDRDMYWTSTSVWKKACAARYIVRLLRTVGRLAAKQGRLVGRESRREGPLGGVAVGLRHAANKGLAQELRYASGSEVGVLRVLGRVRHVGCGLRVGLAQLVQVGRGQVAPAVIQVVRRHEHALQASRHDKQNYL